jgi:cytochrome c oxidase cbb3-type subunit 3
MTTQTLNKVKWLVAMTLLPVISFSQEQQVAESPTVFSNALFNTLLAVIILLTIVVVALNQVLKNLAQSDYLVRKKEEEKSNSGTIGKTLGVIAFTLLAMNASAADDNIKAEASSWLIGGLDMFTFYFMLGLIFLEVLVIGLLLNTLKGLLKPATKKVVVEEKKKEKNIIEILNASVEVENESEIMLDHDYDGIRELDNDLPPWWRYGFYLTILVAVVYLIHYHIALTGDLQLAEYDKEVAKGKEEVEAYMKTTAANVDETTVKMMEGADIEAGKGLFVSSCAACHGRLGEGGVGPNLTDAYWLHGGGLSDVFKTIKYGWPDKGMKSWKEDLSPVQIAQVSSFIKTLAGTNPPNGKAAQGDLYSDSPLAKDSLAASPDTLKINKPDSVLATKGTK